MQLAVSIYLNSAEMNCTDIMFLLVNNFVQTFLKRNCVCVCLEERENKRKNEKGEGRRERREKGD